MPADRCPFAAHGHGCQVVESERDYSGTAARGAPEDVSAVIAPGKVSAPSLLSRMEKTSAEPCHWIETVSLHSLEVVAQPARQAEIRLIFATALCSWLYVFHFQQSVHEVLGCKAITASVKKVGDNAPSKIIRLIPVAHLALTVMEQVAAPGEPPRRCPGPCATGLPGIPA
jgi:hypothetical protein